MPTLNVPIFPQAYSFRVSHIVFVLFRLTRVEPKSKTKWIQAMLLFAAVCVPYYVSAQEPDLSDCGSLGNHYGPFDYTNPEHFNDKLPIVQGAHFTPQVEALIKGATGALDRDIDYTLRAFPNHHRALHAMASLQLRNDYHLAAPIRSADCYFIRAMRFKSDDSTVRMLYGVYLHKRGRLDEAMRHYKEALAADPDDVELNYNLGLLYIDLKDYSAAKIYAQKAYSAGYPLPGLRNRLMKAGAWDKGSGKTDVKQQ